LKNVVLLYKWQIEGLNQPEIGNLGSFWTGGLRVAGGNWPLFRLGNAEYGALYIHFVGFAT
jgi:hypothetical protein